MGREMQRILDSFNRMFAERNVPWAAVDARFDDNDMSLYVQIIRTQEVSFEFIKVEAVVSAPEAQEI